MKQTIKIDGRCWCPQCGHYYDYKEMADEKTCQECVSHLREVKKVDLKKLLESMPDEDINEVIDDLVFNNEDCPTDEEMQDVIDAEKREFYDPAMKENKLRNKLVNEIDDWDIRGLDDSGVLADRIIKLI